jgi:hypothetical protein
MLRRNTEPVSRTTIEFNHDPGVSSLSLLNPRLIAAILPG